jgi:uncharacterized protein (DUF1330 family)
MAAYLVLMQQVDDIDRYRDEYLPGLRPFLRKHGAEVLVAGFDAEPAEGEPPNSTVVLRFADAAAAWGLLNDPGYRPVKEIRFGSAAAVDDDDQPADGGAAVERIRDVGARRLGHPDAANSAVGLYLVQLARHRGERRPIGQDPHRPARLISQLRA